MTKFMTVKWDDYSLYIVKDAPLLAMKISQLLRVNSRFSLQYIELIGTHFHIQKELNKIK